MSEPKSAHWVKLALTALGILAVAGGVGSLLYVFLSGPNLAKYDPILRELDANRLTDTHGRIDLTGTLADLTPHKEMFLTRRPDGSYLAMFPTYYGKGIEIAGLMYTSRLLRENDVTLVSTGVSLTQRNIAIGPWTKLVLEKRVNEHWYRVSRGLH